MASFHAGELEEVLAAAMALVEKGLSADAQLEEADELIAQMRIDARGKEAKAALNAHAQRVASLRDRAALFGGAPRAASRSSETRIRATQKTLSQSSKTIEATHQLLEEMEETGTDILGELARNKEAIHNISGNINETKAELEKADKKVTSMGKWWSRW